MSHAHDLAHLQASLQHAQLHDDAQRLALAWRSLRRGTAARKMRALAWAPDPPQLEMGQIDSLDLLVRHRSWTMCEFATALGIDPSTATRAIGRLIDVGLAERHTSDTDKRVTLVNATPLGRETQRRVATRRLDVVVEALETFNTEERHTLADLLDRLVASLDEVVEREWLARTSPYSEPDDSSTAPVSPVLRTGLPGSPSSSAQSESPTPPSPPS